MSTRIAVATAIGCFAALPLLGLGPAYVGRAAGVQKPPQGPPPFATFITLPSLNGGAAQTQGINDAGTVIVGISNGTRGSLWAVKWTLQDSKWVISRLPFPAPQPYAMGPRHRRLWQRRRVRQTIRPEHPVFWPAAGGSALLGCNSDVGEAHAISANGQIIVGQIGGVGADRQSGGGMVPVGVLHRVAAAARSRRIR